MCLGDDHGARLGECLQAGGEVRRVADHGLLLGRTLPDEVADHHQPGRDAHARGERRAPGRAQPAHRVEDLEPGADRPLGIVLVRLGEAEIGQHAVAQEPGDVAVEARDPGRDPSR